MFGCSNINENSIPYYDSPDFTPRFLNQKQAETRIFHTIPEFTLTDQYNNDFIFSKSNGRSKLLKFKFFVSAKSFPNFS